mgnify:CR=1 FL=1
MRVVFDASSQAREIGATTSSEADLYAKLKSLQRELELVEIQEEYIKDEQKNLKIELLRAQEEVRREIAGDGGVILPAGLSTSGDYAPLPTPFPRAWGPESAIAKGGSR